jgi:hypothetical protein
MIELVKGLPEWVQVMAAIGGMLSALVVVGGVSYRLIRYGIKIKAGVVEIDATDENNENTDGQN